MNFHSILENELPVWVQLVLYKNNDGLVYETHIMNFFMYNIKREYCKIPKNKRIHHFKSL
jgi:hypothetical protein